MNAGLKALVIFLLLSGCPQQTVWQDPRGLTPMSEESLKEGAKRSVGSLRRLAIAPVKYRYTRGAEQRIPASEEQNQRALLSEAVKLAASKGYAVTPLYIYDDIIPQKFNISQGEFKKYLDLLTDWAKKSSDGEEPTAEVINAVAKISRPLDMDGLMIIQGSTIEPARETIWGTMILAGPLFPVAPLFVQAHAELRAEIYEASTGRIVWRGQVQYSLAFDGAITGSSLLYLTRLFAELDAANSKAETQAQQ